MNVPNRLSHEYRLFFRHAYEAVADYVQSSLRICGDWGYPRGGTPDVPLRTVHEAELAGAIWRRLHLHMFASRITREEPYPGEARRWADFAIYDDGKCSALVELKVWREGTDSKLVDDASKLATVREVDRLVLIFSQGGDWKQNLIYLDRLVPGWEMLEERSSDVLSGPIDPVSTRLDGALYQVVSEVTQARETSRQPTRVPMSQRAR